MRRTICALTLLTSLIAYDWGFRVHEAVLQGAGGMLLVMMQLLLYWKIRPAHAPSVQQVLHAHGDWLQVQHVQHAHPPMTMLHQL